MECEFVMLCFGCGWNMILVIEGYILVWLVYFVGEWSC